MLRSEEVVMKLNFLVSSIFLGSALILVTPAAADDFKKEIDTLQEEIKKAEKLIREKQKDKALIIGGAMNSGYNGNCDTACLPSNSSACNDHDLEVAKTTLKPRKRARFVLRSIWLFQI